MHASIITNLDMRFLPFYLYEISIYTNTVDAKHDENESDT